MKKLTDQIVLDSQALQKVNLDFSKQTGQLNDNIKELDKIASDNKALQTVILILNKQIDQLNDKIKDLRDQIAAQSNSKQNANSSDTIDCYTQMLKLAREAKLPMDKLKWLQDGIKEKTGKSGSELVGFGEILPGKLKFFKDPSGEIRIGELNKSNVLHGRGIQINYDGDIFIKRWVENGYTVPGKFILIENSGQLRVGEYTVDEDGIFTEAGFIYPKNGARRPYTSDLSKSYLF